MAWDLRRPVPWRRLGIYLAIYALAMVGFSALTGKSGVDVLRGLAFGIPIAALLVIILAKFGYVLPILRTKEQLAADRAERLAARKAARGEVDEEVVSVARPRPRPAATRRTSTGPSQHPRKTGRKR
jgi:uncharacterized membrane protein